MTDPGGNAAPVGELAAADAGAIPHFSHMAHVIIEPEAAMGATLAFALTE